MTNNKLNAFDKLSTALLSEQSPYKDLSFGKTFIAKARIVQINGTGTDFLEIDNDTLECYDSFNDDWPDHIKRMTYEEAKEYLTYMYNNRTKRC